MDLPSPLYRRGRTAMALLVLLLVASSLSVAGLAAPAGAIEGGSDAADTTFNHTTVRVTTRGSTCSGSLVAPNLVLTAEHCVRHDIPNPPPHPPRSGFDDWELPDRFYDVRHVLPEGINVLFGKDSNNPKLAAKAYEYSIPGDVDIMLVRLTEPVPSHIARPVKLVTDWSMNTSRLTSFLAEQEFHVFGYGKTSATSNFSNIMQEGRSNGAAFPCPSGTGGWVGGDVHRMCLKGANGTGVRSGDSGGPAYWYDANGTRVQVGIFQGLESANNGGRYVALWYRGGNGRNGSPRGDVAGWLDNWLGQRNQLGPVAVPSADFDGDNKPDIIRHNGIWYVPKIGERRQLVAPEDVKNVRIGNFDGDRADELLWVTKGEWKIENLDGSTVVINNLRKGVKKLRFADLNGDGVTDVIFRKNKAKQTFVSWSGSTRFKPLPQLDGGPRLKAIKVVNLEGDDVEDLMTGLRSNGVASVSYGAGTPFSDALIVECGKTRRFGDFKGLGYVGSVRRHC